ncbi:hypothetical protein [Bombilactobacillus thymidiniphilus]|uniref:Uncharacterized protein n=1 Tax=Bombilactobacillus thymidiniphilus TaxID=2923363 RepID=A0ABY4PDD5_9LACO|nr:hypothetical protein [Bombilactobacillus thymidiniphilus]UQS83684.1 hypothetical protein MOO47_00330 [Bombilactobacillus thymidiniphilus]
MANLVTSQVTDVSYMFYWDSSLSHLVLGSKTNLHDDSALADVPKTGTTIPGTNKKVTSPNWVATSGYHQGQKYSSKDLMELTGRDQVTVYDWDSTPIDTIETHSVTRTINFHLPDGLNANATRFYYAY